MVPHPAIYASDLVPVLSELPSRVPAIDPQITACNEAARITQQEHDGPTILIGCRQPVQHVVLRPLFLAVWLRKRVARQACLDIPRTDGVDTYRGAAGATAPFCSEGACKLHHCGLGSVIGCGIDALISIVSASSNSTSPCPLYTPCCSHVRSC